MRFLYFLFLAHSPAFSYCFTSVQKCFKCFNAPFQSVYFETHTAKYLTSSKEQGGDSKS